jgi:ketosteroid isomerase-like protein
MLKKSALFICLTCALALTCFAQNTNSNTSTPPSPTRRRTLNINNNTKPSGTQEQGAAQPQDETSNQTRNARRSRNQQKGASAPGAKGVLAAFEDLLNGIRNADVEAVTAAYWNSPQLVLFNNNGTVTKGWEQMRKNRESSYPEMKDVKLDVRDLRVQMLGREGALLSCLWTQSQTFRGQSESATGRMTLVFRRVGNAWRAIHLHTSPDAPDPSRVLPSEQTQTPAQKRGQ